MINAEASHDRTVEGRVDQADEEATSGGLVRKYPWWTPKSPSKKTNETELTETRNTFEGKNTFV